MRKAKIFGLIFWFALSSLAFSAEKTQRAIGVGGGLFAGMYGIGADMTFRLPKLKDSCLKVGLAVTDSKNACPELTKDWRRYAPLCIDGIHYFNNNLYIGAGMNYPLIISDREKPALGWEAYFGTDKKIGKGKIFIEAGCGELKRENKPSFTGGQVMLGYRYDLSTIEVPREEIKLQKKT